MSFRLGQAHRLRPVLLHLQFPLGHRPRLFFFVIFPVVVGLGLSWLCWASFSFSLSVCGPFCIECMHALFREGVAYKTAPPITTTMVWVFSVHEHGADFFPQPSKTEAGRGSGGATVLSRNACAFLVDHTVTHMLGALPPGAEGNAVCLFSWVGSCPLPLFRRVPFLLGLVGEINFRSELLFLLSCFSLELHS